MKIAYFSEFLGTFFFMFVILHATRKNADFPQLAPILIAVGLLAAITISSKASSGHLNPAVSTAFAFVGELQFVDLFPYIGSQILGAVAAKYMFDFYNTGRMGVSF